MRYWVYINDKVDGPYEEDKLVTLTGFTPDTLICAEEVKEGGSQEWVKASSIFEFDQVEKTINQPLPAPEVFNTQTAHSDPLPAQQTVVDNSVNNLLLEKIDLLTQEITGLQVKLDDMKNKLDAAISSARFAPASGLNELTKRRVRVMVLWAITLTRHDENPVNEEALITNTESLVSQAENIVAAANKEEKPLDMLGPVDLGDKKADAAPTELTLGSKAEEEVVLRSALDSLYNAKAVQTQEEKESTFQDLLTPKQAEALAAQAEALQSKKESEKPTLDAALKAVEQADAALTSTPSADDAAKDALIKELSAEPKEDVLDQVIKEKEEEDKKAQTAKIVQAAALGAAAGIVAAEALHAEEPAKTEPAAGFETVQQAAEEPLPEKQTLDFTAENQEPALSIAPDPAEQEKQEEVLPAAEMPADVPAQPQQADMAQLNELAAEPPAAQPSVAAPQAADVPQLNEISAEPAAEPVAAQPQATAPQGDIPHLESLDAADQTPQQASSAADHKEETMQELVPGAKNEKPEGVLITDADLNEAFAERESESNQSVEQLFGVAPQESQAQPEIPSAEEQHLPQFNEQTTTNPLPMGNPNDLTEIELKEGSTYLISDFVPPAQTSGDALPKELAGLETETTEKQAPQLETNDQSSEVQEMVSSLKQSDKPAEAAPNTPQEVSVSQVILENTIKTKRGATLDIKTVPMVPEPAQSERLNLDNMVDDINTQHDLRSADEKPAGKTTKMIVGLLVTILLAAGIYVMLAFMNLIPPQFNLLSSEQNTVQPAEQNAQMEEMLGEPQQPLPAMPDQQPMPINPLEATLTEVKNFPLMNGYTLQQFIEAKHPAAKDLITWDISTAVDPDNYSILVKVPPENPQSFKISYRFNYNTVTKALDPTISDAKNLLDSVAQGGVLPPVAPQQQPMGQPQMQQPAGNYNPQQGYVVQPQQQAARPAGNVQR